MSVSEILQNIRADVAVFGLCGGLTAYALKPTRKLAPGFMQVFGGLMAAITGTPFVNLYWAIPNDQLYAGVAFILGLSGLGIIRGVIKYGPKLFFKGLELALSMKKEDPR